MGFHEIKEFQKGHIALHASLKQADVEHIGKRHANRFLSDAYCKGLVRGQVECCNLRANHIDGSIVAAERVSSCNFTVFPGHVYLQLLEKLDGKEAGSNIAYIRTRKAPGSGAQHMREAATGQAYSHRPSDSECWWLSPYEFTMHWELVPARIPHSRAEWEAANPDAWDVALTPVGEQKLRSSPLHAAAKLKPSTDYRLKVIRSRDRVCFASIAVLRHNWYLQRPAASRAPTVSSFRECPGTTALDRKCGSERPIDVRLFSRMDLRHDAGNITSPALKSVVGTAWDLGRCSARVAASVALRRNKAPRRQFLVCVSCSTHRGSGRKQRRRWCGRTVYTVSGGCGGGAPHAIPGSESEQQQGRKRRPGKSRRVSNEHSRWTLAGAGAGSKTLWSKHTVLCFGSKSNATSCPETNRRRSSSCLTRTQLRGSAPWSGICCGCANVGRCLAACTVQRGAASLLRPSRSTRGNRTGNQRLRRGVWPCALRTAALGVTRWSWNRKIAHIEVSAVGIVRKSARLAPRRRLPDRQFSSCYGWTAGWRHNTPCAGSGLVRR